MGRLREANVIGVVVNGDDHVHDANDAFLDIIGYTRDDVEAGRISREGITPPDWWEARRRRLPAAQRSTGAFRPYEKEYVHRDGHRVPVLVGAAVIGYQPAALGDLRGRPVRPAAGRGGARRCCWPGSGPPGPRPSGAQERVAFLLQAGDLVAAAQDRHELLQHAAQLIVHSLADFCLAFLPGPGGRAAGHLDRPPGPGRRRGVHRPARRAGARSRQLDGQDRVHQPGRPRWSTTPRPEMAPHLRGLRAGCATSWPGSTQETSWSRRSWPARGRSGCWPSAAAPTIRAFTDTDIAVIEELARQTAVGLANAATSARDHTVAETLQRSVLPDTLPEIPGLDLAVRYLPGTAGVDVGGDWYDAFPLDGGRIGLVIGDVVGHNISSASIMGQMRHLLRAYAVDTPDPGEVLRRTARAQARLLPDALATVVYAVLDPATGELSYANAGHPPPVWAAALRPGRVPGRRVRGDARRPGRTGLHRGPPDPGPGHQPDVLHRRADRGPAPRHQRRARRPGRRHVRAMGRPAPLSAEQTCAAVQAALLGDTPRADDVCLLARPAHRLTSGRAGRQRRGWRAGGPEQRRSPGWRGRPGDGRPGCAGKATSTLRSVRNTGRRGRDGSATGKTVTG